MVSKLNQKSLQKNCYGTSEWSANSGICCNCKWQEECGKLKGKLNNKNKSIK
jgi:hypothetical protein